MLSNKMSMICQFAKIVLAESAKSISDAQLENLALFNPYERAQLIVLYRPDEVLKFCKSFKDPDADQMKEPIVGMMRLEEQDERFPSWDAFEVCEAAAEKGWGPFLFDIAMTEYGTLMIDRSGQVSAEARNVWKYYFDNRQDVEKLRLDDYYNPRTKNPDDDTNKLYSPKTKDNYLNYAFRSKTKIDTAPLKNRHTKLLQDLQPLLPKNSGFDAENFIARCASNFFDDKYSAVPLGKRLVPTHGLLKK